MCLQLMLKKSIAPLKILQHNSYLVLPNKLCACDIYAEKKNEIEVEKMIGKGYVMW